MFTGIIQDVGTIVKVTRRGGGIFVHVKFSSSPLRSLRPGSSVAVSGVCLTVTRKRGAEVEFEIMPETLKATTLRTVRKGDRVNIETALRVGDELGGHIVQGHVDDVGTVQSIRRVKNGTLVAVKVPAKLKKYIVSKGSITLNGVSLTVVSIRGTVITVSLVPHTLQHTTFCDIERGSRVNVEVDVLAKYAGRRYLS